jgi:hypothetical protein
MHRAHGRGTGCHLTAEMIQSLALTAIGEVWSDERPTAPYPPRSTFGRMRKEEARARKYFAAPDRPQNARIDCRPAGVSLGKRREHFHRDFTELSVMESIFGVASRHGTAPEEFGRQRRDGALKMCWTKPSSSGAVCDSRPNRWANGTKLEIWVLNRHGALSDQ